MDIGRIKYLREELNSECIDLEELAEIETAFAEIPDNELRDLRENALAGDMLNELEERVTPLHKFIYQYIQDNFGSSEADDPCYAIYPLAKAIEEEFKL